MWKSTLVAVVIGAVTLLFAASGNAQPLALSKAQEMSAGSSITLVRDGCGPGMRYSNRRGGCVEDDRVGPGPGPGYGRRGYGMADPVVSKQACQQRCLARREMCNQVKGGYFNGCGVEGAACIARCD